MWLVLSNFQTFMTIHGLFLVDVFILFGISQCVKITPSLASLGFYSINFIIFSTIMMDESVYDQHVTIESVYDQPVGDTKRRRATRNMLAVGHAEVVLVLLLAIQMWCTLACLGTGITHLKITLPFALR